MKNFLLFSVVFAVSCTDPSPRSSVALPVTPVQDVVYSYKKQFACNTAPASLQYVSYFDQNTGAFRTQEIVVPPHEQCQIIDIAVCGTMTSR